LESDTRKKEENVEVLGIDIGFGFTKVAGYRGSLVFKSIIGDATHLPFWSNFNEISPTEYFHVTIDGKTYFVGDLAENQSNVRHFTLDQDKLISDFVKILALTAAGFSGREDKPVNVISGLPIIYFKEKKNAFTDILRGRHEIIFTQPDGNTVRKMISIDKICMLPQPVGSALNVVLDDNGKLIDQDLAKKKVGVIDIGFRTTDITILDHLQYIDRGSRTLDTGISKAFTIISNKLRERSNTNVEIFRMYKAAESGTITIKGQEYNFSSIRDQVYARLAEIIASEVERVWTEDWDIDKILFTGGGSMALAQYLMPLIIGNMIPMRSKVDTRLNNVQGYLKYGLHLWQDSAGS